MDREENHAEILDVIKKQEEDEGLVSIDFLAEADALGLIINDDVKDPTWN